MPQKEISLARRIIQANDRLKYLCLMYYRGEMTAVDFRTERAEILKYIEDAGRSFTLVSMPIVTLDEQDNDITGSYPVVS